ncbi:MAG: heme-binding protein [Arthrobacter sp.]|uniref:SOUL family heme-binding protein n=1 Tax=Arthrobacter sp. TaxID=1667 RepID=UPI0034804620
MTQQQQYDVVRREAAYELRRYPAHVVAEVAVRSSFERAGNEAFRTLAGYIGGRNRSRSRVAMTAPVVQAPAASERIAMTAPVVQRPEGGGTYTIAFVLPAGLDAETAPAPIDPRVTLRGVPETLSAAVRYSGRWTRAAHDRHRDLLLEAVRADGLEPAGPPRFARYNPPTTPWFLRRNEVLVEVRPAGPAATATPPEPAR